MRGIASGEAIPFFGCQPNFSDVRKIGLVVSIIEGEFWSRRCKKFDYYVDVYWGTVSALPRVHHMTVARKINVIYKCGQANAEGIAD